MSDFNISEDAQSGGESQSDQSQPIESAFPDEDEETITMLDVIEREDKLEEEASAVLGNSDEKNCTYPKGYISRQALYSCATCFDGSDDKQAAICLACSLECHENHEVYELYTKRNYRCDCGNSKFKSEFECKLMDKQQKKSPSNELNKYNHNFSGRYCVCDKRFPPDESDTSAEAQDEMWQCIICEDWYHTKHLGAEELPTKFDELICGQCVENLEFVHYYRIIDATSDTGPTSPSDDEAKSDDSKFPDLNERESNDLNGTDSKRESANQANSLILGCSDKIVPCESDTNDSQAENKDPGRDVASSSSKSTSDCVLAHLKKALEKSRDDLESNNMKKPLFWSDCSWRSKLCRCPDCLEMYKIKECEYLLDDKDTVQYYEAQGKALAKNSQSPFERGMTALNRMNRAAVVEALHGYDELKANLSDYLRKFAEGKKVVREEDIHEFFSQLKSKKKPKLEYE